MKSIKELAEELGVSKTAVNKKIDNLGLRSRLSKNGNQFAVDEEVESLIKSAFFKKEPTTDNRQPVCENRQLFDVFSVLENELKAKNEQIERLQNQLDQSQKLLDQQQQLQALTSQRVLLLEEREQKQTDKEKELDEWSERLKKAEEEAKNDPWVKEMEKANRELFEKLQKEQEENEQLRARNLFERIVNKGV